MRFIIREQDFEEPLAAGRWQYELYGRSTGTVESWRLTTVADGYRFLRVDLDAREASSGHSYLYHLILDPHGRPERLKFRLFGKQTQIVGDLLFEKNELTLVRDVNDQHLEQELVLEPGSVFWFPGATGVGLLATDRDDEAPVIAVTLDVAADLALCSAPIIRTVVREDEVVGDQQFAGGRPCLIRWVDQARTVLVEVGRPLAKIVRNDGFTAVEIEHIFYQLLP